MMVGPEARPVGNHWSKPFELFQILLTVGPGVPLIPVMPLSPSSPVLPGEPGTS